jgi:hypothetical protein
MTFVIKEAMERVTDFSNFAFDIEPYKWNLFKLLEII